LRESRNCGDYASSDTCFEEHLGVGCRIGMNLLGVTGGIHFLYNIFPIATGKNPERMTLTKL